MKCLVEPLTDNGFAQADDEGDTRQQLVFKLQAHDDVIQVLERQGNDKPRQILSLEPLWQGSTSSRVAGSSISSATWTPAKILQSDGMKARACSLPGAMARCRSSATNAGRSRWSWLRARPWWPMRKSTRPPPCRP